MEQQAAAAPSRPKTSVGFTVGEFAPPPAPAPEPEAAAYAGDGAVDEREYDSEDEYDEDEYDSEEWEFDEEYWTDEEEEQGQGFGRRRKPSRPRVKVPAVLKKQAEQKKHKQIMAEGGVAWQPNKSAKECQQCEKKFTIKVRRHHCRRCGGIFCASCSGKSLAREGQVLEPMRACDTCVAEVEVQPMFAWLSRRHAIPKTAEEVKSALTKVLQFSTNAKMQAWLLSPYTHVCKGGRLISKPDELDERELLIQECLPLDAEQPTETVLLTWARALLFLDERLLELRDRAVPEIIPEVVFWQRYFGQIQSFLSPQDSTLAAHSTEPHHRLEDRSQCFALDKTQVSRHFAFSLISTYH